MAFDLARITYRGSFINRNSWFMAVCTLSLSLSIKCAGGKRYSQCKRHKRINSVVWLLLRRL